MEADVALLGKDSEGASGGHTYTRQILHNVFGSVKPSQLCALMGNTYTLLKYVCTYIHTYRSFWSREVDAFGHPFRFDS